MALPPRFTSELRDRITLSDLVGRRVKLVRAGREFKGCCPFHQEKSASFYVNDDKQFYHCFGCGAHGDAIEFVMQHDNLSFPEAIEVLAAQAGLQVPSQSPQEVEKARKEKDLYSLMDEAARYFSATLLTPEGADARQYLTERSVPQDMIDSFRLGFAPADSQALRRHLKSKGYTDQQMIDAGMIRPSQRGGEPFGFFRDRVIFPVADKRGRIVAFGARVLPEHLRPVPAEASKPPKYINSTETVLFHKGRLLYGESHARYAVAEGQSLIVVEGYLDVMACFQAGFRGAVAPLGTALTEEQIMTLWKMIPQSRKLPILCFDGDSAGRRAAARACDRILPLLGPDQSAMFSFLPEGQDPDSLLRTQGKAALQTVLDQAMPLVDFLWGHVTEGARFDTPEARAGLEKELEDKILKISDRAVQQHYRQAIREKLFAAFRSTQSRSPGAGDRQAGARIPRAASGQGRQGRLRQVEKPRKPAFSAPVMAQNILLVTLLNHPEIAEAIEEDFGKISIYNQRFDRLRQVILRSVADRPGLDAGALAQHLIAQGFQEDLDMLRSEAVYTHAGFARPQVPADQALEGWRETWRLMHEKVIRREIQSAGQTLAQDLSAENEDKMIALYNIHNNSEGRA